MEVLQSESDRTVFLEAGGVVVRKVFHSVDRETSLSLAAREFEILSRFSGALSSLASSTCPRPLEFCRGDEVCVRMERARGVPMQEHLHVAPALPPQSDELARALSEALFCYVGTFDEPYWDFIFRNMFFDADLALVTFLDFGFPDLYRPLLGELLRHHPVEVSLGALVASAIFEAARPKRFRRRREHRRAFELAKLTVEHVVSEPAGARVRVDAVRECARALYGLATTDGGALRQGWYLRAGPLIAQPSSKLATLA